MTHVLLVRLSAMGDLVQSLGAVTALRAVRPEWRITFVTQREWAPLLEGVEGVDRVVCFDRRGGMAGVRRVREQLREQRYDHALDLQGNWKSAFVTRLAGVRDRIGMAARWRQEPWSRLLLRRSVDCEATPHPARAAWELVKQLAHDAPFSLAKLSATDDERAAERVSLQAAGIDVARPFRVVVVTDPQDPRALRTSIVETLMAGSQTLALLGPDESRLELPGVSMRHERGQLRRLVALAAEVAQAGGDVVGPDQGATHVLAAGGAATRVMMGSQDPHRTGPAAARAFVAGRELACRPCMASRCKNPDGTVCMEFAPDDGREIAARLPPVGAVGDGPW